MEFNLILTIDDLYFFPLTPGPDRHPRLGVDLGTLGSEGELKYLKVTWA